MDIKPQNFFIGVIEFFSVLLPGALLTYFLMGMFYGNVFGEGKIFAPPASETVKWIIFLLITYIVGNIIFMVASFIDVSYDKFLRESFFESNNDLTYKTARSIHRKFIDTDEKLKELLAEGSLSDDEYREILSCPRPEIFNTYKWSQHFLLFKNPDALADVQRIEADSKFFRSLFVTFLVIAVLLFAQAYSAPPRQEKIAVLFIVIALLCYYRYGDLRFKATQRAYEMVITAFHLEPRRTTLKSAETVSSADLKQDLTEDFRNRHREHIAFLTRGFNNNLKQIIIEQGMDASQTFISDKNDWWCCLQGSGVLTSGTGSQLIKTRLIPNAFVKIAKENTFSFVNNRKESIEILVLET
jgi:NADH:ubiquinone oxidoreductase subunit 3 (subunit A)